MSKKDNKKKNGKKSKKQKLELPTIPKISSSISLKKIKSFDHLLNEDGVLLIPTKSPSKNSAKRNTSEEDFERIKTIGQGRFAKVVLVRHKNKKKRNKFYAMKIIEKKKIIESEQVEHTKTERVILKEFDHPFIIKLKYAFQNDECLFLVMKFVGGGDIFFHLQNSTIFEESQTRLYIAEICLAIKYLHESKIVYRDLKPENILLGLDGHLVLSDFGLSKIMKDEEGLCYTFCGSPEYLAPELIDNVNSGYSRACDLWSIGVLTFEFLYGSPPFYSENVKKMYHDVVYKQLQFPKCLDEVISSGAKDFITKLLTKDPAKRLGANGWKEIMNHSFFKGLNWDDVYNKRVEPIFVPDSKSSLTANIDESFLKIDPEEEDPEELSRSEARRFNDDFRNFEYVGSPDSIPDRLVWPKGKNKEDNLTRRVLKKAVGGNRTPPKKKGYYQDPYKTPPKKNYALPEIVPSVQFSPLVPNPKFKKLTKKDKKEEIKYEAAKKKIKKSVKNKKKTSSDKDLKEQRFYGVKKSPNVYDRSGKNGKNVKKKKNVTILPHKKKKKDMGSKSRSYGGKAFSSLAKKNKKKRKSKKKGLKKSKPIPIFLKKFLPKRDDDLEFNYI